MRVQLSFTAHVCKFTLHWLVLFRNYYDLQFIDIYDMLHSYFSFQPHFRIRWTSIKMKCGWGGGEEHYSINTTPFKVWLLHEISQHPRITDLKITPNIVLYDKHYEHIIIFWYHEAKDYDSRLVCVCWFHLYQEIHCRPTDW